MQAMRQTHQTPGTGAAFKLLLPGMSILTADFPGVRIAEGYSPDEQVSRGKARKSVARQDAELQAIPGMDQPAHAGWERLLRTFLGDSSSSG